MAMTLQQLLTPTSLDDARQIMIDRWVAAGYTGAASWQSGSIPRTLGIELLAYLYSSFTNLRVLIAKSGFNSLAEDDFLDLLSQDVYDNVRTRAIPASGPLTLTASLLTPGPLTIVPGQLIVGINSNTYRNTTGGTLAYGTPLTLTWQCETPGHAGDANPGDGASLITSIAGVSAGLVSTGFQNGADADSNAVLQLKNSTKWATLAAAGPAQSYINWALNSDPGVITRVAIDAQNPSGPGTINVFVAGNGGALLSGPVALAQSYINLRKPEGALPTVASASAQSVAVTANIRYSSSVYAASGDAIDAVQDALEAYFEALPIGGTLIDSTGYVTLSALYSAANSVPGIVNVTFSSPASDYALTPSQVAVPAYTLTASAI